MTQPRPYECVAMRSGTHCLTVSWWAPVGSVWRPFKGPEPGALNIYVAVSTEDC